MSGPSYSGRNRPTANGEPQGVQRSYASQLKEHEPLFNTYEHLQNLPRGDSALKMLRKVASMVKPIMRKRGWRVEILAEFLPREQNLLGLNINKGFKICIRLRYHNNPDLFLPIEEVVDTMLHELSHNVWGEHDSNFHKLWDELRDEYEVLVRKGYTGEGFLSQGRRLGGSGNRLPPQHEMRRLARASAEKRKTQGTLGRGSGQRLGGTPLHMVHGDVRQVIADQVERRNQINRGCASGHKDAGKLSEQSSANTFKTQAEEDDANNRAIAQALFDLMEEEEAQKLHGGSPTGTAEGGLAWSAEHGLYHASMNLPPPSPSIPQSNHPSEEEQMAWALRDSMNFSSQAGATDVTSSINSPLPKRDVRTGSAPSIPLASKPRPTNPSNRPVSRLVEQDDLKSTTRRKRPISETSSEPASKSTTVPTTNPTEGDLIDLTDETDEIPSTDDQWTCEICTCINPMQFLACDACGVERSMSAHAGIIAKPKQPKPKPQPQSQATERWRIETRSQPETLGWLCTGCGAFMEHKWWTCSACGTMKSSS